MTPAKVRDFIPELAKQIGIPEEDYNNMVSFYCKENKKIASSLQHLHIVLRGLGTLSIQGWLLEEKIKEAYLKMEEDPDKKDKLSVDIAMYTHALDKWKEEKEYKKEMRKVKKEYYINKTITDETQRDITNSLEEQGSDS